MATNQTAPASVLQVNSIPICNVSMSEALDLIDNCIERDERRCFLFANAHCINVSATDDAYRRILTREDTVVFGDGFGTWLAGLIARKPLRENVNGTDMFPLLCARAVAHNQSLFLLGGLPGVADEVAKRMTASHPGLRIAGARHGYFSEAETDRLLDEINASGADVLLVGLGVPRQERWIAAHRDRIEAPAAMAVGGLFDFYSGRIPRAPLFMRRAGFEWVWRLCMEPRRLWRRYLIGNVVFLARIMWWRLVQRSEASYTESLKGEPMSPLRGSD